MNKKIKEPILWLSLGENCLPDDILRRHNRKSFSTPYSSGRSNIDYAITLESQNYKNFLNIENLVIGDAWGTKVVRSSAINQCDDIYDKSCSSGFEFTHHNPIEVVADRESLLRKIERLQEIKGIINVVFLYHHRYTKASNIFKLREKIHLFKKFYSINSVKCYVCIFYQQKIILESERRMQKIKIDNFIFEFKFHTKDIWGGIDKDIFWARNDDDLIVEMLKSIDEIIESQ